MPPSASDPEPRPEAAAPAPPAGVEGTPAGDDREASRSRGMSFLVELAQIAFFAIALYLILNFAIQTVAVFGPSSYPNLEQGDYLIASKIDYRIHSPQRGDFVIIRDPWDASQNFIKRVIGLPGEMISIRNAHVYINGKRLIEPYLSDTEAWTYQTTMAPIKLRPRSYFVMGDNRNHSTDSRDFGPVSVNDVEAKAWVRVWPLNRLAVLDTRPPHVAASA
ncbi:MAG: signal peptidase I [Candidatus Dormibacteraceae bacterium]